MKRRGPQSPRDPRPDRCGRCRRVSGVQVTGNLHSSGKRRTTQLPWYGRNEDLDEPRDVYICIECGFLQYHDGSAHHVAEGLYAHDHRSYR